MTIRIINTGTSANSGNGDTLRVAFTKINNNFQEIATLIGSSSTDFTEIAQDAVSGLLAHQLHNGLTASYNDAQDKIILNVPEFYNQNLNTFDAVQFNGVVSTGTIFQGTAYDGIEYSDTSIRVDANTNSFAQMIMKNHSTGSNASTDLVIMNNNGDNFTNLIDLGINSSNYENIQYGVTKPNDGYLFVNGGDLVIGTQSPDTKIVFHAGGTAINESTAFFDQYEWVFNRRVTIDVDSPSPLKFTVINRSSNVVAQSLFEVVNNLGTTAHFGINSSHPEAFYGQIGPNEAFLHVHGSTATMHLGSSGDLKFYSDESNGYSGTPTLVMSRIDQSSTFAGHVLPDQDSTYDLGSTSSQWRSLYVSTSTVYFGGIPLRVTAEGGITVNDIAVSGSSNQLVSDQNNNTLSITTSGDVVFSGEIGGVNRGLVWDYGAETGGVNSMVRQDINGLTVRAWTEPSEEGTYAAPVNIVTNQDADQNTWEFDSNGNLTLPVGGDILDSNGNSVLGGSDVDNNIWIQTFASADGFPADVVSLASSVEYDNAGNIIALFSHQTGIGEFEIPSGSYFSVAKFTAAGQKLWQVRLAADMGTGVYTDGWGLAVDNVDGRIYVAGRVDDEVGYSKSSLIKLNSEDGSLIWSNVYDFGDRSDSPVVDVDSEGDPIMVGYLETDADTNDGVTVTKIDKIDGTIIWSRLLDGQNDDEAYGMAVGPTGEVVAVGYMAQYDESTTYPITPQTGSGVNVLVINRSDLSGAVFSDTAVIAGTGITGTIGVNAINVYTGLTGTVREGTGAVFDISVSGGTTQATITTTDLATATATGLTTKNADNIVTPGGWGNWLSFPDSALRVTLEGLYTMNQVIPVEWAAGSTSPTGFIMIQYPGDGTFQITPVQADGAEAVAGTWYFDVDLVIPRTYGASGIQNNGTNYLVGHKIKVLGTSLGGATPDNDCIVTVDSISEGGLIFNWSVTGVPADNAPTTYTSVSGTNYQTGSGLEFDLELDSGSTYTEHPFNITAVGSNYVDGDVVTISGALLGGTSPDNDLTTTVSTSAGGVSTFNSFTGTQQTTTYRVRTDDEGIDFSGVGTWTLSNVESDQTDRMLVVKYDSTGTISWQKAIQFDEGYNCNGADADIDSEGNVYVCGSYDYDALGDTYSAMNLVKFDSSGVKQWSRRVAGDCEDFATSIVVGLDDTLYLSGVTSRLVDDTPKFVWVVAKYTTSGAVVWQRLIENTTSWTFGGAGFFNNGGGSNIAVGEGYVALSGGFGVPFGGTPAATVVQVDTDGTVFTVGDWEFKAASFSGTLNSDASDITVVNAGKVDSAITGITVNDTLFDTDTTNFLIPTLYGAGSVNSQLTNGAYTVALGSTGTLTLPAGGTITEGYVTSNPTIQLTPASPDVASQKLVIKGGGNYTASDNGIGLNWYIINPLVNDTVEIYVNSPANANQTLYWWIYPEGAGIASPESGTVTLTDNSGNFSFTVDSDDYEFTVRVSPEANNYDPANTGVETQLFNSSAPTLDADHHLHLTTGNLAETSIFLGTDDHNVRTTTDGGIEITTPNDTNNVWRFDNAGILTVPGDGIIQSVDNNGRLRSQLRLDQGSDITRLSAWTSPNSVSFSTSDWTTGTYTNNNGTGVIEFTGAENILNWLSANNYADRFFFSVNDGPQMANEGYGTGGGDITFNVATPPATSPTTVTSFSIYYQFESRLDIDTDDEEFYILSTNNDLYLETRQSGNIDVRSVNDLTLRGDGLVDLRNTSATDGVRIITDDGDHSWNFGVDGGLTFPDATVQTTAHVKTSGEWTVTPGDNTYSFTVPVNGVYQLWVRGNVPNGIISYTATAAVTNANVGVLGTQYAWNYTGAGNPILFTSIPNQFIAAAEGTISTTNPAVGTSTNTFVFGIDNNTEEDIIVDYGYTKIS